MSKTPHPIILTYLLLIFILVACGAPSTPTPVPETETPVPTAAATETATLIPVPTATIESFTATLEFAPICAPAATSTLTPAGCQLPIAEQSSTYCSNKNPYNLILINAGASYEVLGERIRCSDQGMIDGKKIIACTGPIAEAFALEVCDPACAPSPLQTELTQCPQEFIFDSQRGCCAQELQPTGQECVVLKLQTKSCVINCSEITKKAACEKISYACVWDETEDVCKLR